MDIWVFKSMLKSCMVAMAKIPKDRIEELKFSGRKFTRKKCRETDPPNSKLFWRYSVIFVRGQKVPSWLGYGWPLNSIFTHRISNDIGSTFCYTTQNVSKKGILDFYYLLAFQIWYVGHQGKDKAKFRLRTVISYVRRAKQKNLQ